MNKLLKIVIMGLFLFVLAIFIKSILLVEPKSPKSSLTAPVKTQELKSEIYFYFENQELFPKLNQVFPVSLSLNLGKTPGDKGITGISVVLSVEPSTGLLLTKEDIKETLPAPWKYIRKEINRQGQIVIEAVYLQAGETGETSEKLSLVSLNFLAKGKGNIKIAVDSSNTKVLAKENNLEILLEKEVYSTYEVKSE